MGSAPRKRRRSGNIQAAKMELWAAAKEAAALIENPDLDVDQRLRAISALSTCLGVYHKVLVASDLDEEIKKMEKLLQAAKHLTSGETV